MSEHIAREVAVAEERGRRMAALEGERTYLTELRRGLMMQIRGLQRVMV